MTRLQNMLKLSLQQAVVFLSPGGKIKTANTALILCINLASFISLSYVAFMNNEHSLFQGLDGSYMMTLVKQQFVWAFPRIGFGSNFLQSLGNVSFPLNAFLIPGYCVPAYLHSGVIDPVLSYVIFATELFIATTCLFIYLCRAPGLAATSAWVICILTFPYGLREPALIYPILVLAPTIATLMAEIVLISILFYIIGRTRWFVTVICSGLIFFFLLHIIVAMPSVAILAVPMLVLVGISSVFSIKNRSEFVLKLCVCGVTIVSLALSGSMSYLYGVFKYTAAFYFQKEFLNVRTGLHYVSVAFWSNFGLMFCLSAAIGSIVAMLKGRGPLRALAMATFAGMTLIFSSGLILLKYGKWHGPSMNYFEFVLWPFYTVYSVIAVQFVFRFLLSVIGVSAKDLIAKIKPKPQNKLLMSHNAWVLLVSLAVAILPWFMILPVQDVVTQAQRYYVYPPLRTRIINNMIDNIGLVPGRIFRGRVATMTGQKINRPIYWLDLHALDGELIKKFGNDHRMVGLWYYDIPTMLEYSSLITPPFYLLTRHFFARTDDRQLRTIMTWRQIEPVILRMLGIRYIITDAPVEVAGAKLRNQILSKSEPELFLYEFENVNVGQYSPTRGIVVADAHSALIAMSKADFDPTKSIVVEDRLPENLIPASSGTIQVERGKLKISAVSTGSSVMLLPIEYSNCLKIKPDGKSDVLPVIFRANLLQSGILFSGKLSVTLEFFTGPFQDSGCRIEDISDMNRLNIGAEARGLF